MKSEKKPSKEQQTELPLQQEQEKPQVLEKAKPLTASQRFGQYLELQAERFT